MLGNFSYCNPTKLYFGENALQYLNTELPKYGKNVVLIYGGGSVKKNGIYDEVVKLLHENGKDVAEISGVMPNPTVDKLYEGVEIARSHHADLLLAVCIRRSKRAAKPRMMVHRHRVNGAAVPDVWCTAAVGMVHTAAARFHYSGIPLRLRMDSPSIWMV